MSDENSIVVAVHGGAGRISPSLGEKKLPVIRAAVDKAWKLLGDGVAGEVAVAEALRLFEESEYFNAGYGGYPNQNGVVLLDAGIMKGSGEYVALMNVRKLKFPSAVVLDMLKRHRALTCVWTHELMTSVEKAKDEVKARYGLVKSHEDLMAPMVREMLNKSELPEVAARKIPTLPDTASHDTVGCVVRDAKGDLFAGTSTGGVHLKHNGRIGDSPIVGAGFFADNEIGALSASGDGEAIMRSQISSFLLARMRAALRSDRDVFDKDKTLLAQFLSEELSEFRRKSIKGGAGLIVVPPRGSPVAEYNTPQFSMGIRVGTKEKVEYERIEILSNGATLDVC